MTEASELSLSIATKSFPNGGRMTRTACGRMTWRIASHGLIPSDRAASVCPRGMDSRPAAEHLDIQAGQRVGDGALAQLAQGRDEAQDHRQRVGREGELQCDEDCR